MKKQRKQRRKQDKGLLDFLKVALGVNSRLDIHEQVALVSSVKSFLLRRDGVSIDANATLARFLTSETLRRWLRHHGTTKVTMVREFRDQRIFCTKLAKKGEENGF